MRNSIVAKLRGLLEDGIDSEYKVVYLLCEVRKLLEKDPPDPAPFCVESVLQLGATRRSDPLEDDAAIFTANR
jgi:hypothetical protein